MFPRVPVSVKFVKLVSVMIFSFCSFPISIVYTSEKDKKKEVCLLHKIGKCNWGASCHRSHEEPSATQDEYVVLIPSAHLRG